MTNTEMKIINRMLKKHEPEYFDFTNEMIDLIEERQKANNSCKTMLEYDKILIKKGTDIAYKYMDKIGKDLFFLMFTYWVAMIQYRKLVEEYILESLKYIGGAMLTYMEKGIKIKKVPLD